jgi:4-amino-4-deoxy-L-arabinose transferase-like glycosyltransferase
MSATTPDPAVQAARAGAHAKSDVSRHGGVTRRTWIGGGAAILVLAALLRGLFPTADPPWRTTVGVVWHDEGAWTHNARNRVLFGTWATDDWNPLYIAPVFTGLEYGAFRAFGVGLWQARSVSMLAGVLSVLLLGAAVRRVGGNTAGLIAAGLLATNYVWVMYSRAALMEASMVAFMVASFWAATRAEDGPRWGLAAGLAALAAYFTKAAAVSFVAALGLVSVITLLEAWRDSRTLRGALRTVPARGAAFVLAGLVVGASVAAAVFVLPNWQEYRFYNWQMSVTRKPAYTVRALVDRASWFPLVHDIFTRMWFSLVVGTVAVVGMVSRLKRTSPPERLVIAWLVLGSLQLVLHDVGNERRLVYLIPAFVAATALALGRDGRLLPADVVHLSPRRPWLALPLVLGASYLVAGSLLRLAFLYEIGPGVRWSALAAVLLTALVFATWPRPARLLSGRPMGAGTALGLLGLVMAGDVAQYVQWATGRTYRNVEAMRLVAGRIPAGTLVHGKLANGLALESGIRPVFVGNHFGNYEDRLRRDEVRYILTYVSPTVGYEGPIIREVLDAYPAKRLLWTVPVAESAGGADLAALFEKNPAPLPEAPSQVTQAPRAQD